MPCPAHAGMYRNRSAAGVVVITLPRARGDVPTGHCTGRQGVPLPRARGDVPQLDALFSRCSNLAPRTRGCTGREACGAELAGPCPAHAGMYRAGTDSRATVATLPRARGDVPFACLRFVPIRFLAPRTRGCTGEWTTDHQLNGPCPAHAGMYRQNGSAGRNWQALPRARGDVPLFLSVRLMPDDLAPRTRGCTAGDLGLVREFNPCPAHAGMYRKKDPLVGKRRALPRARGDVPQGRQAISLLRRLAPRTRGCTETEGNVQQIQMPCPAPRGCTALPVKPLRSGCPCPAHAGMYR